MKRVLSEYIDFHSPITLVGMCKNAGKTTVLGKIIQEMDQQGITLGLTSIGRDGEPRDIVTGTQKPDIYVKAGTIFATAAGLLKNCDTTHEILKVTGIHTPLGEIVIIRALSDGFVDLAGPSMNRQLTKISELFLQYQVDKILIDGAMNRKSLCSAQIAKAVILCTGASYHPNMDVVVKDTKFTCQMLQLKKPVNKRILSEIKAWQADKSELDKFLFLDHPGNPRKPVAGSKLADCIREKEFQDMPYIWSGGAFTDGLVNPLLMSNISLKDKCFLVEDSSKILLNRDVYEKLCQKGASLLVAEEIELLAVAVNPFSSYGSHFDIEEFQKKMCAAVKLPVVNVREGTL